MVPGIGGASREMHPSHTVDGINLNIALVKVLQTAKEPIGSNIGSTHAPATVKTSNKSKHQEMLVLGLLNLKLTRDSRSVGG